MFSHLYTQGVGASANSREQPSAGTHNKKKNNKHEAKPHSHLASSSSVEMLMTSFLGASVLTIGASISPTTSSSRSSSPLEPLEPDVVESKERECITQNAYMWWTRNETPKVNKYAYHFLRQELGLDLLLPGVELNLVLLLGVGLVGVGLWLG